MRRPPGPVTLGVEEEYFLVDAETGALVDGAPRLLARAQGARLQPELFECIVEATTPVATSTGELRSALARARAQAKSLCEPEGLRLFAAGTHPASGSIRPRVTDTPHFREVARRLGPLLGHQVVCGLHVHVGLGAAARTGNALEGVVPWLPAVLALSVNSPFEAGREASVRSARAARLAELASPPLPPAEAEPAADRRKQSDWWDVRVNRRHGTLEVRVPDQQTDVARSVAFAALVQALAVTADERENDPADRRAYVQARDAALHGACDRAALARQVEPAATALGTWETIVELLESEPEAERQLRVAHAGGLAALVRDVVERTLP